MRRRSQIERAIRYADVQQVLNAVERAESYQGERLSERELAEQLGVRPVNGRIRGRDLVYACLHVGFNPEVRELPRGKRLQIINSALGILDEVDRLSSRRGKAHRVRRRSARRDSGKH